MTALGRVQVCESCLEGPAAQTNPLCDLCGDELDLESLRFTASMGIQSCPACRLAPPEFTKAVAFAPYDKQTRELLHLIKFEGQRELIRIVLGSWLAQAIAKLREQTAAELIVVPVPLFAARERERGFNQATLLAKAALDRLRKTHPAWKLDLQPKALRRVKNTKALFALDPAERRRSLKGAFRIGSPEAAEAIRGREVLLVDDIMTTGATARECSRVLLRAGAAKVWVATVAKAQPDRAIAGRDEAAGVARWDAPAPPSLYERT
jgi:ComF family protein